MSEENSFGSMLKWARIRMYCTQQQVADKLEVSRGTVTRWENDLQLPSAYNLKQLVTILDLNEKEADALYRAAAQVPPVIDNLPFQRNPFFTGREEHLKQLREELQETGTAAITQSISISGLGGIGKTQLALEYAHRSYPNVYRAALWVNAEDEAAVQASYDHLAQILELPERNEQELDRRIQAVKDWLKTHTNWLLIMDNADDLPLALSLLPAKPLGHVILTTRSQIVRDTNIAVQIKVEEMEPETGGLPFLLRRSGVLEGEAEDIRETALQVVELLGGLPLALDQAGAYFEERRLSFTDYIKRYHAERHRLLNRRGSRVSGYSEHPEPVAVTLELSFKEACKGHPLATDILHFCSFLQPDDIPEELFQHDNSFKFDTTEFDDAIAALQRYSLINLNSQEKTFSMHRLVQAVLIDDMFPDLQKQWRERVARALNAAFKELDFKEWGQCKRLVSHALVCATWTEDELTPTVGVAELFQKAGIYLLARGQYSVAEPLLTRALSIYKQHLGVEHLLTAYALQNQANLYMKQGKYGQSELLHQQAIAILERQLGAEHPETAKFLLSLAALYMGQEKIAQAEQLVVRALSIQEKHLGTAHPDTALSLALLGTIYYDQNKFEQAESLYRHTLKIFEEHQGADHPSTVQPLYQLALVLHLQGKHEQAEALYQRAISILEQRFGATHPLMQRLKSVYADFRDAVLEVDEEPPVDRQYY
jgi:tetratricopeptide (TPR) repeat protein